VTDGQNYDSQDRASIAATRGKNVALTFCARVGKTLTDLQILGSELHQNAFGGWAPPGPAGGAIALPTPPSRY